MNCLSDNINVGVNFCENIIREAKHNVLTVNFSFLLNESIYLSYRISRSRPRDATQHKVIISLWWR